MEGVYRGYAGDPRKQRAWSAANAGNRAMRAELAARVLPLVPPAGPVLDVGCGTGWWLAALAAAGVAPQRLTGVELQPGRVAAAAARVPGAAVVPADAAALPFADDAIGLLTLFTVLSSLGDDDHRRRALREARRVTRPGGRIAVWEPRIPTGNAATARVARALLRSELGPGLTITSLTLLPPLARRVDAAGYRRLVRLPLLRSHRLIVATV